MKACPDPCSHNSIQVKYKILQIVWEMGQCVKCLLCKHEDWVPCPRTQVKSQVQQHLLENPALERQNLEKPRGCCLVPGPVRNPVSKHMMHRVIKEDSGQTLFPYPGNGTKGSCPFSPSKGRKDSSWRLKRKAFVKNLGTPGARLNAVSSIISSPTLQTWFKDLWHMS